MVHPVAREFFQSPPVWSAGAFVHELHRFVSIWQLHSFASPDASSLVFHFDIPYASAHYVIDIVHVARRNLVRQHTTDT